MAGTDVEKQVRLVIEQMVEALNAADARKLAPLLADRPGSMHVGSDPEEWWTKRDLLVGIREAMEAGGAQVRAEVYETTVHSLGDVAWSEGRGRFLQGDGRQREFRHSGVFVRDGDVWQVTQSHASIGVPNIEMFGSRPG